MKLSSLILTVFTAMVALACSHKVNHNDVNIVFLHHSTGEHIWGVPTSFITKVARRLDDKIADKIGSKALLPSLLNEYNKTNKKNYSIKKMAFPRSKPYGWHNYPYDYYNIWVKNAGPNAYMDEPTLEILTKDYQVIIFKHCFPVSNIQAEGDSANVDSRVRTLSNMKLQYNALKDKLHEFPSTKFILFTGAVQVQAFITEEEALRAREFFNWVKDEWDLAGDNIYLWDLYSIQTDGGLYFKDESAKSPNDSHPGKEFSEKAANLLFQRIIDIIENDGTNTLLTGEGIS